MYYKMSVFDNQDKQITAQQSSNNQFLEPIYASCVYTPKNSKRFEEKTMVLFSNNIVELKNKKGKPVTIHISWKRLEAFCNSDENKEFCHGLNIYAQKKVIKIYFDSEIAQEMWLSYLRPRMICVGIEHDYEIGETIGNGTGTTIHSAVLKQTGAKNAVKCIPVDRLTHKQIKTLANEVTALR